MICNGQERAALGCLSAMKRQFKAGIRTTGQLRVLGIMQPPWPGNGHVCTVRASECLLGKKSEKASFRLQQIALCPAPIGRLKLDDRGTSEMHTGRQTSMFKDNGQAGNLLRLCCIDRNAPVSRCLVSICSCSIWQRGLHIRACCARLRLLHPGRAGVLAVLRRWRSTRLPRLLSLIGNLGRR